MTLVELVADVIAHLDRAGVPYMLTGSLASTYYGEPRATRDVDVVIDPASASLQRLVARLEAAGYYVDRDAAVAALRDRSQFNAVADDGMKVDFIIRKARPFSAEEFRRRQPVNLLGTPGYIATVEDMILAKLEWAVATGSDRQLRDIVGMLAVGGVSIDRAYLARWVDSLGLGDAWRRLEP